MIAMSLIDLTKLTPAGFPTAEDDEFEFKSSLLIPVEAKRELNCAASAFSNSGGGCFIWGVADSTGDPDGGVAPYVGKLDLEAWIDQVINEVDPRPSYKVQFYWNNEGRGTLNSGMVIVAVSIRPSLVGPHMAKDKRYYIRAGKHTLRAGHFLVEALWARRQVGKPVLSHVIRRKPDFPAVLQLGIVALTDAPAVDVELNITPLKGHMANLTDDLPLYIPVIDRNTPFYMDLITSYEARTDLDDEVSVVVTYHDLLGNEYAHWRSRGAIYNSALGN
jgi:hypothetical protein